jgi:flagellar brake protein
MVPNHIGLRDDASSDMERYQVHSRLEIIALMRSIIEHRAFVTMSFGNGSDFIVSALLAMNPDFEELVFDCGADEAANKRLAAATRISLTTELNHIKIQFTAQRVERIQFQAGPAFRVRLPDTVARLQRRDSYRVRVPLSKPATCTIQVDVEKPSSQVVIRIFDVSCGGVALVDYPASVELIPGHVYPNCHIDLREIGRVTTDVEIMHVMEKVSKNAVRSRMCGCRFRNMPNAVVTQIQRYINKIEREQKAHT